MTGDAYVEVEIGSGLRCGFGKNSGCRRDKADGGIGSMICGGGVSCTTLGIGESCTTLRSDTGSGTDTTGNECCEVDEGIGVSDFSSPFV